MVEFIWYVVAGILAGILGGMGMGGGTLLIPLLSIFYAVGQHTSQAINLISFIPMAVVALIIHFRNKLVKKEGIWIIIIPAVIFASAFSFFSKNVDGAILKKFFGCFLILLSFVQFFSDKIEKKLNELRNKNSKQNTNQSHNDQNK